MQKIEEKKTLFLVGLNGLRNSWYLGSLGVTIFFVLSGFLITYLLILENKKQSIDINKFYIRRILRIWPIYYLYFFICLGTMLLIGMHFNMNISFYYLFFLANIPFIFKSALPFLDHFWSIGVEEQFYLFWPWLFKKFKKNLFSITLIFVIVLNLIRYLLWYLFPYSEFAIFSIVNRFDCMMIGALGAMLYNSKNILFLKVVDNKITQCLCWIGILIVAFNIKFVNAIVDTNIVSIISLGLIIGQINIKNRLINLDLMILNFLGKISYGIYVYHILIIFLFSKIFDHIVIQETYKVILIYASIILSTLLVAYLSFEYFEKYFIKLKSKFSIIKSSSIRV